MQIDWNLARVQYENFNIPLEDIAEEYGVSLSLVEYAAEKDKWERNDLAAALQKKLDVGDVDESLLDEISGRIAMLQTVKSSALLTSYVSLEAALLSKCIKHVRSLDATNLASAPNLKVVAEVLKTLRDQTGGALGSDKESGSLTVKILNQVNIAETPQTEQEVIIDV